MDNYNSFQRFFDDCRVMDDIITAAGAVLEENIWGRALPPETEGRRLGRIEAPKA